MRKLLSIILGLFLVNLTLHAQPVDCGCTNCPVAITDNGNFNANIWIQNTGPNILGVDNCLQSVCFTVNHTWIGDLDFTLTAPDGTCYIIMGDANNNAGGCGSNCDNLNVCITLGTGNPAGTGTTEYATLGGGGGNCVAGNFTIATGVTNGNGPCNNSTNNLNAFNNGTGTVSGMWTLTIGDNCGLDTGSLTDWSLNFCDESGIDCSSSPLCLINNFTANISACSGGTYSASGTISFTNPPTSGALIVEDCNGTQYTVDTYPWPGSGNVNYNIPGLVADGQPCDLTAYFSADLGCTLGPLSYTAPTCPCYFSYMSTNISACDPNDNTFDITGSLQFVDPPTTGVLTVTDCNGNSSTYFPPFVSPLSYAINNINSDGTPNCTVTASFSANPSCSMTSLSFNYPSGCMCSADAGTYNQSTTGSTNSAGPLSYDLCFGDQLNINALGDYNAPDDYTGTISAPYNPGLWLLWYDCPPTIGPPDDINLDPCFAGVESTANGVWSILNNVGDGSTLWFVPVTMYSMSNGIYAISINGGDWCYDLGPVYEVTFLEDVTANVVENCQAGTAAVTVSGGLPASNGSNFTASNLLPAGATLSTTSTGNNGTITISGLQDGDNYSLELTDGSNCSTTITGTFTGTQDPSFSYPQNAYCKNATNPSPTITGVTGGTFTSSPAGLSINAFTGLINLAASTVGTYTVTYTTPDPVCFDQATFVITINPVPVVDGNDVTVCAGGTVTLNGTGANTYVWTGGVTDGVAFPAPASTTTYNVTGTITATGCSGTGNAVVTVNPLQNASFTTTNFCQGSASPPATITGTSGGTFAYNPDPLDGSSVNPASGSIINGVGGTTYSIQYTTPGPCAASSTQTVSVLTYAPVDAGPDVTICAGDNTILVASGANTYNWLAPINASGASQTVSPASTTTYTVNGTDISGCSGSDQVTVTVNPLPTAVISGGGAICINSSNPAPTITFTGANGTAPYTFTYSINGGANQTIVSNGNTAVITAPISVAGVFTYSLVSVSDASITVCDQLQGGSVVVTVNALPNVDAGPDQTVCLGEQVTLTGGGATNYVWSNGISDGVAFTPSLGTTVYTVTGTDANGCENTDQVSVIVNPLPNVFAGNDVIVCEGDQVVLTGSGAQSYVWDQGVNNGQPFTPAVGTTTFTVIGTDANGCENQDQVNVTVEALPVVSFIADPFDPCAPATVTFTNTSIGNISNCVWTISNGTTVTGCGSVTVTFPNGGMYDVTLTTTTVNQCSSSATYTDFIYVEDLPNAAFSVSSSEVSILNPQVWTNNSSTGASSYVWNFNDGSSMSNEFEPTHIFPGEGDGTYLIELIAYSPLGCPDTAWQVVHVKEEVIFYVPNTFTPDNDDFNQTFKPVFTAGYDPFDYTLLIFDRWGEVIWESHNAQIGWDGTYANNYDVQDGTYVWRIEFKTTATDERILVTGHVNIMR